MAKYEKKTKDADKALDVIGHKLKIKEEIDMDFNERKLKDQVVVMQENPKEKPQAIYKLKYNFNNKDFGLNLISGLNLGKAYKLTVDDLPDPPKLDDGADNSEDDSLEEREFVKKKLKEYEEPNSYNIDPNAIRVKYSPNEKEALDEEALDYRINKIKQAKNAVVVIENIFTRVTTSNYKDVLPYKEQLKFIYDKLNDPVLIGKIVALNIGAVEQEIMHYSDLNLMEKLGNMLGIPDKVVKNCSLEIALKDNMIKDGNNTIKIIGFNAPTGATVGIFNAMRRFADTTAGYDVYYNTTAKQNGMLVGETIKMVDGKKVKKPCYFVCFGPMSEYDKKNLKRQEPYVLNKFWYNAGFEHSVKNGVATSRVRLDFEDYAYPHKEKNDFSSLVSSVISDDIGKAVSSALDNTNELFKQSTEQIVVNARREMSKLIQEEKLAKKQKAARSATTGGKE